MSDPKCKTCKFFWPAPMGEYGTCGDKSKVISDLNANPVNYPIETWSNYSCNNHDSK